MKAVTSGSSVFGAVLLVLCTAWPAHGAVRDCGQPVSAGALPSATDALAVLKTAVGSRPDDLCVCDVDNSGTISPTDALIILKVAVGQSLVLACPPCSVDSDGDGLSDQEEIEVYHSDPYDTDSDDDGIPDGQEVKQYGTSPALADTDGDGVGDREEILTGGRSPRLADLPQLRMELSGDPNIRLDIEYTVGEVTNESETLTRNTERVDTDTVATKMSIENTVQLHTETEGGTGQWPPSFAAKLTTDSKFHHGYFHDTSSSWEQKSAEEVQSKYSAWEEQVIRYHSGGLTVAMRVTNDSPLTIKVKNLVLNAYRDDGGGNFTVIDTMEPDPNAWPEGGRLLGPWASFTMISAREINDAATMKALVKNPTGLLFEVGSYEIFRMDSTGTVEEVNYDVLGETVVQRTGTLVVDYGEGTVERYMVATNVEREPSGKGRGVNLGTAMSDIIGLSYDTEQQIDPDTGLPTGRVVLSRIENVESFRDPGNPAIHGFWTVAGTDRDFYSGQVDDFDATMLRQSELITLVYLRDSDGDAIYDREEYLLGTDKLSTDTDADGLSDFDETKVGWTVQPAGKDAYDVYPDPRVADADGDLLKDPEEKAAGTDPYLRDTDGDGTDDKNDELPLDPLCLTTGVEPLIRAWWDGSYYVDQQDGQDVYLASDLWGTYRFEYPLDGVVIADEDPARVLSSVDHEPLFLFNTDFDDNDQYITVADDPRIEPSSAGFAVSATIDWFGLAAGATAGTVIGKGPDDTATYRLALKENGDLEFSLYRYLYSKCWFTTKWFGSWSWDDGACKDDGGSYGSMTIAAPAVITANLPTKIVATYYHVSHGNGTPDVDRMSLYVERLGKVAEQDFGYATGPCNWCYATKHYITPVDNADDLRIGGGPVDGIQIGTPYRGTIDEVQFFQESAQSQVFSERYVVDALIPLSVCRPDRASQRWEPPFAVLPER